MLFNMEQLKAIKSGDITVAFRRWRRPTVRAGGTLRTAIGVLDIKSVDRISERSITSQDLECAGFSTRPQLLKTLAKRDDTKLYRIEFRCAGADPRVTLRKQSRLKAAEVSEIIERLHRLDRASRHGQWTRQVLDVIQARPGVRAGDLAEELNHDRDWFKKNVRKLKDLGLTESLEIGYRLSPRGRTLLKHLTVKARRADS